MQMMIMMRQKQFLVLLKECDYEKAEELFNQEKYEEALEIYETISEYRESEARIATANNKILYQKYGDVIDLLNEGAWFFNGGSDHIVTRLLLSYETATITTITFDGNGRHDRRKGTPRDDAESSFFTPIFPAARFSPRRICQRVFARADT